MPFPRLPRRKGHASTLARVDAKHAAGAVSDGLRRWQRAAARRKDVLDGVDGSIGAVIELMSQARVPHRRRSIVGVALSAPHRWRPIVGAASSAPHHLRRFGGLPALRSLDRLT